MADTHPEAEFGAFLEQGRFMLQRSRTGGACFFYPRVAEPGTGNTDLEWVEASGDGVVYSTTVIRQKPPTPHYNLALIDLAEGARLMSRVEGVAPEGVRIGMKVRAKVIRENNSPLLVFEPA
jgi:uncharacterized protein